MGTAKGNEIHGIYSGVVYDMSGFIASIIYITVVCIALVISSSDMSDRLDKAGIKHTGTDTLCVEVNPGDTVCYINGYWRKK